ncbi:(2,3-dihydroxybenzoyl)adenylate synthase [Dactylosporangium salmoneum]|uniref:(2,3-dihydroxybenzoyl)adenylate synthase n=1 Tax=Dactylosporangium salmoneum TaxID=53361 RepID=A0ABP5U1F4_9ACTN
MDNSLVGYPAEFADRYRAEGLWLDRTIPAALRDTARAHAGAPALITPEHEWTYAELVRRVDNVAAGLVAAGLRPGEPVLLQVTNSAHAVAAFYGILRAGARPVCTLALHRRHEIAAIGELAGAAAHLVQADLPGFDLVAFAGEIASELPTMRLLLTIGAAQGDEAPRIEDLAERDATAGERAALDAIERDTDLTQPAVLQLSGGTTGTPKLIPRLHPEYWYNGTAIAAFWRLTAADRLAFALPIAHNAGMANGLFAAHATGAALLLCGPRPDELLGLMAEHRATWTLLSPGITAGLLAHPGFDAAFAALRNLVLSAAAVPRELFDELERRGVHTTQAFGMTEGLFLFTPLDAPADARAGGVGDPISPLDEVRLLEPGTESPVADGEPGELCARGPYTIRGYLNAPERNREAFTSDGFYRSGDLMARVVLGGQPSYVLMGRVKDLINRGGEKINAEEVELLLAGHPAVQEAALVAMPDPRLGERGCVFVVTRPGQEPPTLPDLCAYLERRGVAKYKWPERLEHLSALPRSNIGKVLKRDLREAAAGLST